MDVTVSLASAALGVEQEHWPPYISNLVFELWELQPPQLDLRSNMAQNNTTSSSNLGEDGGGHQQQRSGGPHVVRVLYNKQPIQLPGASEGKAWSWLHLGP